MKGNENEETVKMGKTKTTYNKRSKTYYERK